jgi:hypothetical protein
MITPFIELVNLTSPRFKTETPYLEPLIKILLYIKTLLLER